MDHAQGKLKQTLIKLRLPNKKTRTRRTEKYQKHGLTIICVFNFTVTAIVDLELVALNGAGVRGLEMINALQDANAIANPATKQKQRRKKVHNF